MSVSIDGKVHRGTYNVKYGEEFPKPRRSMEMHNEFYGNVLVYVISIGIPKWTEKMSVKVPIEYYITQITDPSNEYKREHKRKKSGLRLVKN